MSTETIVMVVVMGHECTKPELILFWSRVGIYDTHMFTHSNISLRMCGQKNRILNMIVFFHPPVCAPTSEL